MALAIAARSYIGEASEMRPGFVIVDGVFMAAADTAELVGDGGFAGPCIGAIPGSRPLGVSMPGLCRFMLALEKTGFSGFAKSSRIPFENTRG